MSGALSLPLRGHGCFGGRRRHRTYDGDSHFPAHKQTNAYPGRLCELLAVGTRHCGNAIRFLLGRELAECLALSEHAAIAAKNTLASCGDGTKLNSRCTLNGPGDASNQQLLIALGVRTAIRGSWPFRRGHVRLNKCRNAFTAILDVTR